MWMLLSACTAPPPDTSDPVDPADPDYAAPPSVPLACTEVTGTTGIWLVDRSDPTRIVGPADRPEFGEVVTDISGPTADGTYWLVESGTLKRSDDEGCTWLGVGAAPASRLATSAASDQVVSYDMDAWLTPVGLQWRALELPPKQSGTTLVIDAVDPLRMRADVIGGIATSVDGGATWTTVPTPDPEVWYSVGIDGEDLDRIAIVRNGLWTTDNGADWTDRGRDTNGGPVWSDGKLHLLSHGDQDDVDYHLHTSDDAGATFDEIVFPTTDPHLSLTAAGIDDGLLVMSGYRFEDAEDEGVLQVTRLDDLSTTVHRLDGYYDAHGVVFAPTHAIVGFQGALGD